MKSFIAKIKSYLPQKTISYQKSSLSPERDWFYMLCVFFTGILLVTVISWNFYSKIRNGEMWKPDSKVQTKIYKLNNVRLLNTLDYFKEKNEKFQNFKNDVKFINDPFL